MTDHPLYLPSPAAQAAAEGRLGEWWVRMDPQPKGDVELLDTPHFSRMASLCAPYSPGDSLYVREGWKIITGIYVPGVEYADGSQWWPEHEDLKNFPPASMWGKWRSPITMPKWAARTWLRVEGVEVRRVQSISGEEARGTGIVASEGHPYFPDFYRAAAGDEFMESTPQDAFKVAIERRHPGSWAANEWYWRVTLRREER